MCNACVHDVLVLAARSIRCFFPSKRERVDSGPPDRCFFCARFWRESVRREFLEEERWLFVVCDLTYEFAWKEGRHLKLPHLLKAPGHCWNNNMLVALLEFWKHFASLQLGGYFGNREATGSSLFLLKSGNKGHDPLDFWKVEVSNVWMLEEQKRPWALILVAYLHRYAYTNTEHLGLEPKGPMFRKKKWLIKLKADSSPW